MKDSASKITCYTVFFCYECFCNESYDNHDIHSSIVLSIYCNTENFSLILIVINDNIIILSFIIMINDNIIICPNSNVYVHK